MDTNSTAQRMDRTALARQCLEMIAAIATRGARSADPGQIGYAMQELTQVLFERTGQEDILFSPVSPDGISDLPKLYDELDLVNSFSSSAASHAGNIEHRFNGPESSAA